MLLEMKTVTIPRLLELCPPGTVDPTIFLYDGAFYFIGFTLGVAGVSNALIRKVDPRHFESNVEKEKCVSAKEEREAQMKSIVNAETDGFTINGPSGGQERETAQVRDSTTRSKTTRVHDEDEIQADVAKEEFKEKF